VQVKHLPPSSAEVKNMWRHTSVSPTCLSRQKKPYSTTWDSLICVCGAETLYKQSYVMFFLRTCVHLLCEHPVTLLDFSGVPRNFGRGGGVQQIQLRTEDRENGDLGAVAPLFRVSGGSCNLVQEISFHIVKFS
jgi:hypothetical protein